MFSRKIKNLFEKLVFPFSIAASCVLLSFFLIKGAYEGRVDDVGFAVFIAGVLGIVVLIFGWVCYRNLVDELEEFPYMDKAFIMSRAGNPTRDAYLLAKALVEDRNVRTELVRITQTMYGQWYLGTSTNSLVEILNKTFRHVDQTRITHLFRFEDLDFHLDRGTFHFVASVTISKLTTEGWVHVLSDKVNI